jgi:hypothetical protein
LAANELSTVQDIKSIKSNGVIELIKSHTILDVFRHKIGKQIRNIIKKALTDKPMLETNTLIIEPVCIRLLKEF